MGFRLFNNRQNNKYKKYNLKKNDEVVCDLPLKLLVENAPEYDRSYDILVCKKFYDSKALYIKKSVREVLFEILSHVNFASKNGFTNNMIVR